MAPDWFDSETPLHRLFFTEIGRLRRRARPRWWLVVLVGVVLTAALVRKISTKPQMHRARVVLVVSEGDMNSGWNPGPLNDLRQYIATVLLSNERLIKLIDDKQLFVARRARVGDKRVLDDLRDLYDIVVWRNYFLFRYEFDERRTARVAIVVTTDDPTFSYDLAHHLAALIQEGEMLRLKGAADDLAAQAAVIDEAARERIDALGRDQRAVAAAIARAQAAGDAAEVTQLQIRQGQAEVESKAASDAFNSLEVLVSKESLEAAVTSAGLALGIEIIEDRRPPAIEVNRTPTLVAVAIVGLLIFLPLAGVVVGAFDTRVHDADDVTRLGLPMLGHIPGFPGDDVGALRDRGVGPPGGASLRRWLRSRRMSPRRRRAKSST